jgi:hypothetical protein
MRLQTVEIISFPKPIDLPQPIGRPKLIYADQLVEPLYEDELNAELI